MKNNYYFVPTKANTNKNSSSLLELFFDLIFVVFIGGFVHRMTKILEDSTFDGFGFAFTFLTLATVILVWRTFTVYSSRYEQEYNFRHRLITFMLMIGLVLLTAAFFLDFGSGYKDFNKVIIISASGYGFAFVTQILMTLSVALKADNPWEKKRQLYTSIGIIIASSLSTPAVIINVIYTEPLTEWISIGLWSLALLAWSGFSFYATIDKIAINTRDTSLEHLQERFGIIFIVFIGESVIQSISGSSNSLLDDTIPTVIRLVVVFSILFSWWWWFNDTINFPDIINHPRKIAMFKVALSLILISLAFTAIGLAGMMKDIHSDYPKYALALGMTIWAFANALIFLSLKNYNEEEKVVFPPFVKILIYALPLWATVVNSFVFIDGLSSLGYLYIAFSMSILLIPISLSIGWYRNSLLKKDRLSFEKTIQNYYIKEDKWIKKYAVPLIDKELHKKYNYDLNHFSKYIKDKRT